MVFTKKKTTNPEEGKSTKMEIGRLVPRVRTIIIASLVSGIVSQLNNAFNNFEQKMWTKSLWVHRLLYQFIIVANASVDFWSADGRMFASQLMTYCFGLFPTKDMQTPLPIRSGHICMKDAYNAESNKRSIFRFLFSELWMVAGRLLIAGPRKRNPGHSTFRKIRAPCLSPLPMPENLGEGQ